MQDGRSTFYTSRIQKQTTYLIKKHFSDFITLEIGNFVTKQKRFGL